MCELLDVSSENRLTGRDRGEQDLLRCSCAPKPGRRPRFTSGRIAMAYKLIDAAQTRWRAVNAHPVAILHAGALLDEAKLLKGHAVPDRTDHRRACAAGSEVACYSRSKGSDRGADFGESARP